MPTSRPDHAVIRLSAEPTLIISGGGPAAEALERQGVRATRVAWTPPATGSEGDLAVVMSDARRADANAEAVRRIGDTRAVLVDVLPAREALGLRTGEVLHAGPPIEWQHTTAPLRGALVGAVVIEEWAGDPAAAVAQYESGGISIEPCHHRGAVGPAAGVITPATWVWVLEDTGTGRRAYCSLDEGLGKTLRYGAYSADIVQRSHWMAAVLGPALQAAVRLHGPIDVTAMLTQSLEMGDDGHLGNRAGTLMLMRELTLTMMLSAVASDVLADVMRFIGANESFFRSLSMAACKLALDSARAIPGSTLVVAMAANGTECGIQVSGTGNDWFTGPAQLPRGAYLAGYGPDDASPDIGDCAITETSGLGGFALASAPAAVSVTGGTATDAVTSTRRMFEITVGEHPAFRVPALDFRGAPLGIDVSSVIRTGILPQIATAIAGRVAGVGRVGAGLVNPPAEVFTNALRGLAARVPASHSSPASELATG
jgi:Protein of unknown function (DUF1116)